MSRDDSLISFTNVCFEMDELVEGSSSTPIEYETPKKDLKKKMKRNVTIRPLLASTPRVAYRVGASSTPRISSSNELELHPLTEFIELNEDVFHDLTANSQGYRFMNEQGYFEQKRWSTIGATRIFRNFIDRIGIQSNWNLNANNHNTNSNKTHQIAISEYHLPRLNNQSSTDNHQRHQYHQHPNQYECGAEVNSGGSGGNESYRIENARDDRDHINLSELFIDEVGRRGSKKPVDRRAEGKKTSKTKKPTTMGSLHRSEPMKLYQMILVKEAAYDCVAEIGKYGNVQFNDLNSNMSMHTRNFVKQLRRCDEMERKLRFLEKQVITCDPELDPQSIDFTDLTAPSMAEFTQIEARLDQLEKEFMDLNENDYQLRRNLNHSKEFWQCMKAVDEFFHVHREDSKMERTNTVEELESYSKAFGNDIPLTPLLHNDDNAWFVAGVLPWDKRSSFERILWRACRRTAFVKTSETYFTIIDPETLEPNQKCAFIAFFKGESLGQIIEKVCDGFNGTQYPCPKTSKERKMKMVETEGRINDLTIVINTTQTHRYTILKDLSFELPDMLKKVQIQKSVFHILNMFTVDTNGFLAGECWIPAMEEDNVRKSLHVGYTRSGTEVEPILNHLETSLAPPTYHKTNKFTKVFQNIVDSYGVSKYREINPAPYTIITFPFLFAVMFGDAAHGFILLLFGLLFIANESKIERRKNRDEIFDTFYGGRYIIMLMGLFSIYTGALYNDAFAKAFNVFGSSWSNPYNMTMLEASISSGRETLLELTPEAAYDRQRGPYPFGVDPVWNVAENRLNFLNSMKMKASVIIGIAQMAFGVVLSLLNHCHFGSYVDVFTNFVPQITFLACIFVYLCAQIVVKWIFFSVHPGNIFGFDYPGSHCAPSLLIGLINMFMLKSRNDGYYDEDGNVLRNCHLGYWYQDQGFWERILLAIAVVCVPIMLFGNPLSVYIRSLKKQPKMATKRNGSVVDMEADRNHDEQPLVNEDCERNRGDEHSLSDVFVHQAIHTIEFVLGCVSHTASYLRLWALSLAHAQLSEVVWHMVLIQGLNLVGEMPNYIQPIFTCVVFFIFATLSLSILIMMEGLSAFLHALRLHWVEFQSKFYLGTGHSFNAFHLKDNLESAQSITDENDRMADVTRRSNL